MIPVIRSGEMVFSDTFARFGADLLDDAGRELLKITGLLDRDSAGAGRGVTAAEGAQAVGWLVDAPGLIAAASYCHWVADHVREEITRLRHTDLRRGAEWAAAMGDSDAAALFLLEQEPVADAPPCEPPPFPVALQAIHRARRHGFLLDEKFAEIDADRLAGRRDRFGQGLAEVSEDGYARRLDAVRETLAEARAALDRNRTSKSALIVAHVDALSNWLCGPDQH